MMANTRLKKKETINREPVEFVDIESDDIFLTIYDGHSNNNDENVQQLINIEVISVGCETPCWSNHQAPPSNNFYNIEEPLSSWDEFDQVEDEVTYEDDVIEGLNLQLSWRWRWQHLFFLTWKIYEALVFWINLLNVTFYDLASNLCSVIQVYEYRVI